MAVGQSELGTFSPCHLVEFQRFDLQFLGQHGACLQLILQILNATSFVYGLHVVLLLVASQQHGLVGIGLRSKSKDYIKAKAKRIDRHLLPASLLAAVS